jgi:ATP-dependent helicase/nuclease subunit A
MSGSSVPDSVLEAQLAASDPDTSAWVSANAGSGKTYVLAQRVIRLLLDGADPAKMLCLTFTKAAAANMAIQVFGTLARWTALDDAALDEAMRRIEGRQPSPQRRQRARRLFAEALETPGGLKVQTIHAFCTSLLYQFPFEADVAARFDVLEERAQAELIDRLRLQVLMQAAGDGESPLGRALATAIVAAADTTFADVVREAIAQRDAIEGWIARAGDLSAAITELSGALGVAADDTQQRVETEFLAGSILPAGEWPAVRVALASGSKTDREHIARLAAAQAGTQWSNIVAYLQIFCTAELAPRQNIVTKAIRDAHPALFARLVAEQGRVCGLLDRRRALVARDRTAALMTIADAVIRAYRAEKERRGLLDYADLIDKTLALFDKVSATWVMYKLDLGIDHVLIDEAQDTSPKQWEVIRRLVAEFFAGAGARGETRRSIFAVGDEKQSIYSFQGAAPHRFEEMRQHFAAAHAEAGLAFEPLKFRYSFRSTPDVLHAVDTVFGRPEAYRGLTADPVATVHEAVRHNAPGSVEIWPLVEAEDATETDAWDLPLDTVSEGSAQVRLARRIATTVATWIARRHRLPYTHAPVRPGDVLVLVRQRGALFEAIIRALKDADIEVAGADRLMLTEHIAAMDLMSLADALLLEDDDLALAETLKSPLFGFDDEDLFALASKRPGSLRGALRAKAGDDPRYADAAARLDVLAEAARRETPFAFYARLLGARGARRRMLARLGLEAADALDEFLALALDYEARETPSLQGFVAWMRTAATEIKRDMDIARDEVRVMTVHGAKGLEAPIVILADTATRPTGPRDPRLLTLDIAGLPPGACPPVVWSGRQDDDMPPVRAARHKARRAAEDEHQRLLYVAMTRAADRLIVCGARGVQALPKGCWYDLVHDALAPGAEEAMAEDGKGMVRRWRKSADAPAEEDGAAGARPELHQAALPDWLTRDAPPAPASAAVLTPSGALEAGATRWETGLVDRGHAPRPLPRGRHVHRLLQALPDIPNERRAEAARRYLARADEPFDAAEIEDILAGVLGVLADPAFAPLFGAGTRAEVPLVGRLARGGDAPLLVSGQVDRLAVTTEAVLIADYKSDRRPPRAVEDVPQAYTNQLALYRAVLAPLYPGRSVRAVLAWTEVPRLMELPPSTLDAALSHLGVKPP